jgi:hypothetical protein
MGLWWQTVDATPPGEGSVTFEGDPNALSKRWPILWRYHQDWYSLKVVMPPDYRLEGWVYFQAGEITMKYRRCIMDRYIMVRVGPNPVTFWVETRDGRPGSLSLTGGKKPGILRRNPDLSGLAILAQQAQHGTHAYM